VQVEDRSSSGLTIPMHCDPPGFSEFGVTRAISGEQDAASFQWLRGYGRSVAAPVSFDDDLLLYSMFNRVSDVLGLVRALGYETVAAVVARVTWTNPISGSHDVLWTHRDRRMNHLLNPLLRIPEAQDERKVVLSVART
jgi:hypothetical protein